MDKPKDFDIWYGDKPWGNCRVRVYKDSYGTIVVLTEQPDNPGPNISRASVEIANLLIEECSVEPQAIWIEHYPPPKKRWRLQLEPDRYYLVTYLWSNGQAVDSYRRPLSVREFKRMTRIFQEQRR